ncbi:MAG: cobyrinic acid a,c-diamide synthase [Candidatus Nanopelagicaceae bacterium]|nr:cobyrinic acid a,c-diamide synthase [Candidatus Nanopelagicaceae bacterium]
MSRRASLPGADELFRSTTPALTAVRNTSSDSSAAPSVVPVQNPTPPVARPTTKGVRTTPRRRVSTVDRSPSGRESHAEKITVYLSPEELFDLDQARLLLRGDLGLAADRGRIVRESIAVIIADLEAKGEQSILARRLRGL